MPERRMPTLREFAPGFFDKLHECLHVAYPGEPHDEETVIDFWRGFLQGIRFGVEYRTYGRILDHIYFKSPQAREAPHSPLHLDMLAAWMSDEFNDNTLEGDAFVEHLRKLRTITDGESTGEVPVLVDGKLQFVKGQLEPDQWWQENWGDFVG